MNKCPRHIQQYAKKLTNNNKYFEWEEDEYHLQYSVKCTCGNEAFEIIGDEDFTTIAKCTECKNEIILYDLRLYPAAIHIECDKKPIRYITKDGDTIFNVAVHYEYSQLYEDEEFNPDDITWCIIRVYGLKSNKIFEILDDETA